MKSMVLRKELEDRNYKGGKAIYDSLTSKHMALMGPEPAPQKVYVKGKLFLNGFDRVVVGAHGPYVEFEEKHLAMPLEIKPGRHTKYRHCYPVGFPGAKIYYQLKTVSYADYRVGRYYFDLYDVELNLEEEGTKL